MINSAIEKVKQIGCDRCGSCPAFWASTDYWGESDAGCMLNRDIEEFCSLSLLPKFLIKPMIKREEKRMDDHYAEWGDALEKDEREMEHLQNALIRTLEGNMLELCFEGKKVDVDYEFSRDLLSVFKKLREATPEPNEQPSAAAAVS